MYLLMWKSNQKKIVVCFADNKSWDMFSVKFRHQHMDQNKLN